MDSIRVFFLICAMALIGLYNAVDSHQRSGRPSAVKPGDHEAQQIANAVRSEIESHVGGISDYRVESYTTQVVAGMNYLLKIRHGPGKYLHAKVYKHWSGNPIQLSGLQKGKSKNDTLDHF